MKLGLILLLHGVTLASTLVLSPANQLQSDLQASRFSAKLHYDSPLVPSDPTLANVIYFLGIVARSDFNQQLEANTYTSPFYPQIEITSHGSTEARYLLWGVYLAATDMVKYTRFNDVVANLFWDNRIVGQISLTATPALDLPSTSLNGTRSYAGESNTSSDLTDISSSPKAVSILNSSSDTAPALSTGVPLYALQSSRFAIDFDFVPGADRLRRTEVFLAFSAAIIHVAKFSTNDRLHYFSTRASDTNLYVHMSETGTGCLVKLSSPRL